MDIHSMDGQKTRGKGVKLEDRVMEGMRVRMNKVVCVCVCLCVCVLVCAPHQHTGNYSVKIPTTPDKTTPTFFFPFFIICIP